MRQWLLVCLLSGLSFAASAQVFSTVEEQMSAAQFREAGLDKLSPEELAALNTWLRENLPEGTSAAGTATPAEVDNRGLDRSDLFSDSGDTEIVSRIDGTFEGWGGKTIFKLENGQVWQQSDTTRWETSAMDHPEVRIKPKMLGSWLLQVEGTNRTVRVRRVR